MSLRAPLGVNVAVAVMFALILSVQFPVPVHAPVHPVKVSPDAGVAVRVTDVPELSETEHVGPQLMVAPLPITVPEPVPDLVTVRVYVVAPPPPLYFKLTGPKV